MNAMRHAAATVDMDLRTTRKPAKNSPANLDSRSGRAAKGARASKSSEAPATKKTRLASGAAAVTMSGLAAPTAKLGADAIAARIGRARGPTDQNVPVSAMRSGDTRHRTRRENDAVVHAQYRRTRPSAVFRAVFFSEARKHP